MAHQAVERGTPSHPYYNPGIIDYALAGTSLAAISTSIIALPLLKLFGKKIGLKLSLATLTIAATSIFAYRLSLIFRRSINSTILRPTFGRYVDMKVTPGPRLAEGYNDNWKAAKKQLPESSQEVFIPMANEEGSLHAIWTPVEGSDRAALIIGGNVVTAEGMWPYIRALNAMGWSSVTLTFRGYGKSEGERYGFAGETTMMRDANQALKFLNGQGYPTDKVMGVGHSTGCYPLAALAKYHSLKKLRMLCPYTSFHAICMEKIPFSRESYRTFVPNPPRPDHPYDPTLYSTSEVLEDCEALDLVVFQGTRDAFMPPHFGPAVAEAGKGQCVVVEMTHKIESHFVGGLYGHYPHPTDTRCDSVAFSPEIAAALTYCG